MNAILRTFVVVSSSVVVATALLTSMLCAAPLHYQIDLKAGPGNNAFGSPLAGANLQLNLTWDAVGLTPLFSDATNTLWPSSNSIGSLTVSGSAASDGVYNATFSSSPTLSWVNSDNAPGAGDRTRFPVMSFNIGGSTVITGSLEAKYADSFFNAPHPFFPKPFSSAEATWNELLFLTRGAPFEVTATVLSGDAEAVPEPTSSALAGLAIFSLAALRRRK